MKKEKFLRYLTTIGFLVFIAAYFVVSMPAFVAGGKQALDSVAAGEMAGGAEIETVYNDRFPVKTVMVTINGGVQRLFGARNVNERYLLDNGQMTYIIGEYDMTDIAGNTVALRDMLAERDIPMLYVNTPFKIDGDDKQLPVGVEDYSNENADRFLSVLEDHHVNTLDLRDLVHEQGLNHGDLFYRTDHHWKAETGFWAFTEIINHLKQIDASLDVDDRITDLTNYEQTVYENSFWGTAGRRVGVLYSGMDDLTIIAPKFSTSLRFSVPEEQMERTGDYRDTVMFMDRLKDYGLFQLSYYTMYCGQDYGLLQISNNSSREQLNVTATPKRILLIKDSFSCVVIPFLALAYDEVCCLDLRLFDQDLTAFVEEYQPDLVMVMYNPGAYENNNLDMFDFLT